MAKRTRGGLSQTKESLSTNPPTAKLFKPGSLRILGALLITKVLFFAFASLCIQLVPSFFDVPTFMANFQYPKGAAPTLTSRWITWDAQHYLYLSEEGYKAGEASNNFYPMVPAILKAAKILGGESHLFFSFLFLNAISLLGLFVFYRFAERDWGTETAVAATALLLAFPGAMFFSLLYSEGPFLLLSSLFLWFLMRDNYRWASVMAFLLPLNRAVGILVLVPLAFRIGQKQKGKTPNYSDYLYCLSPLAGWAAYFLVMYLFTGNPFDAFEVQKLYKAQASFTRLFDPIGFVTETFNILALHSYMGSLIDRLWMLPVLAGLGWLWSKDKTLFAYALLMALVPAFTARYASYTRYVVLALPLFVVFGERLKDRRWLFYTVLAGLAGLQTLFLLRYLNNHWAG